MTGADFWIPEESSGEIVAVDQLESAVVRTGLALWRALCGAARFAPTTGGVTAAVADNAFLVDVLENDYRYRGVGAALVRGFDEDFSGLLLSELAARRPRFGLGLRMLYDMVRTSGEPMGYRGWVGKDMPGARFTYHENVILPFGGGGAVAQLMVVSALVARQAMPARP